MSDFALKMLNYAALNLSAYFFVRGVFQDMRQQRRRKKAMYKELFDIRRKWIKSL